MRQRTKNLIVAGVVGAVAMGAISSVGGVYLIKQQSKEQKAIRAQYETRLAEAEKLLQRQKATMKSVVVTSKELAAGVKLTSTDLKTIEIPETEAPTNMILNKNELIGKVVKIDVGKNTPLITSMVFDEGPTPRDLRSQEYNVIILPTKIQQGQFLDVRITFPTGEEFIVLAKKKVQEYSGTTVWFHVSESEMLLMSSAIVDAYLQGAKLSAVTYVDPYMQGKAIPNYPANVKVIDLIQSNPNVLETAKDTLRKVARKTLESNLSQISEADKARIQNGNLILQQEVANNQLTNQQNNQAVTGAQTQSGNNSVDSTNLTPVPSTPTNGSEVTSDNNVVQKEEIVRPNSEADKAANEQKQQDVFEQPLVK
ncbi:SAF domain-containing protein [Paenibacillus oralis]|nr:SAF domain-containing protein [Paenibacillus oralis]